VLIFFIIIVKIFLTLNEVQGMVSIAMMSPMVPYENDDIWQRKIIYAWEKYITSSEIEM